MPQYLRVKYVSVVVDPQVLKVYSTPPFKVRPLNFLTELVQPGNVTLVPPNQYAVLPPPVSSTQVPKLQLSPEGQVPQFTAPPQPSLQLSHSWPRPEQVSGVQL